LRKLVQVAALVILAGCGDESGEIPAQTRLWLETRAGELAPAMTLPESLAGGAPDSAAIAELLGVCDADPELYSYFYACLSESIGVMDEPSPGRPEEPADAGATAP
jgi:hypothetical protein